MDNLLICLGGAGIVSVITIVAIVAVKLAYRTGLRDGTDFGLKVGGR